MGQVHVFWGDGKGKTSLALGMALRALGAGLRVHLVTFLKDPRGPSGEITALERLPGFTHEEHGAAEWVVGAPTEGQATTARRALAAARSALRSRSHDLVILDEVLYAVSLGALAVADVLELLEEHSSGADVILTGAWEPPAEILDVADLATELRKSKHPFDAGEPARRGFEF